MQTPVPQHEIRRNEVPRRLNWILGIMMLSIAKNIIICVLLVWSSLIVRYSSHYVRDASRHGPLPQTQESAKLGRVGSHLKLLKEPMADETGTATCQLLSWVQRTETAHSLIGAVPVPAVVWNLSVLHPCPPRASPAGFWAFHMESVYIEPPALRIRYPTHAIPSIPRPS
jgi:hypothetical protein